MSRTPGEVRARTCGTKSPSRSEALRFIDSSNRWGFGWVDKAQCFRSARRFGAAGSSPDFSRGFSRHGAPRPLSWTFFLCLVCSLLLSFPYYTEHSTFLFTNFVLGFSFDFPQIFRKDSLCPQLNPGFFFWGGGGGGGKDSETTSFVLNMGKTYTKIWLPPRKANRG